MTYFQPHQCSITPPDKAASIKQQMDFYLEQEEESPTVDGGKSCNFCGTKKKDRHASSGCEDDAMQWLQERLVLQ